jgi:phosphatidylglycerophosphatase A
VGWADRLYKLRPGQAIGWMQGFGILFDDLVAAACTLLFLALWIRIWNW